MDIISKAGSNVQNIIPTKMEKISISAVLPCDKNPNQTNQSV